MAEPAKDNDQSMEDILQSIKRIIADEGEAAPAATSPGSDVLELTELLAEDVATPTAAPIPTPAKAEASQNDIDALFADVKPVQPEVPEPAPVPVAPAPAPVVEAPVAVATHAQDDGLMSDATLNASLAALKPLAQQPSTPPATTTPSAAFRSGMTVEDLVIESLKPMLKEWLDSNLPGLVRQLVEKEIRRLSSGV